MTTPNLNDIVAIRVTICVQEDENGFFGSCKEFPGVVVGEMTEEDCLEHTRGAVREHLDVLLSKGLSIPEEAIIRNADEIRPKQINSIESIPVPALAA
ncbi:MAG: type II toxin-antitoxin system HicB family antitoxin [Gammaproteobacteria bacterium]|nr:type II toxin-antitoxin system HicB family antitoxin [Gammaproteobacteria bacterium]MYF38990.1 type II toxin-antitoxin system HicB family antitoxin [Gammaproteobacteria bacterium]